MASACVLPPRGGGGRVSFLFRRSSGSGHCGGVNALALSSDESRLWTGSRDSIITCWDATTKPRPALVHEHSGHIDWVNDLALVGDDVLVSCSSDKTLRVWQPDSPEPALGCLTGHSDYVTCLAASAAGGMLASGGLRGEVLLWDLAALRRVMASSVPDQGYGASPAEVPRDSVYCIAMNAGGSLLAAGSTQALASVVDVRSGQAVMQLKGHTDNIRAMRMDGEGRLLLTGSSDHTIRLWDLGQQRCVQTLAVHTDSVWALEASTSFGTVYSGGRDGCIYRTRLATRVTELLAVEQQPVVRLAVGASEDHLWAATTSPTVHKWEVDRAEAAAAPATPRSLLAMGGAAAGLPSSNGGGGSNSAFIASPSAAARARLTFELHGSRPAPQQLQPAATTPGIPPIHHAAVLTDRRHVLTQDDVGTVLMWDITTGAPVHHYGQCDLKDVEQQLFQPSHSVSAWFAPEVKLGSLAGSMESPQCFGAEIYAVDLGDEEAPIDLKVNFGEQMINALFSRWAERRREQQQQQQHTQQQLQLRRQASGGGSSGGGAPAAARGSSSAGEGSDMACSSANDDSSMPDANGISGSPRDGSSAVASSRFSFQGKLAPVVMVTCGGSGAVPWRCAIDSFTGEEDVPQWVADCVLHGQYPLNRELKMGFQLLPLPGCGLPSLLQSSLNAPRVLRINKVADYVRRKMEEQGVALREEPLFWDPAKEERWQAEQAAMAAATAATAADSGGVHQLHPVQSGGGAGGGDARQGAAAGAGGGGGSSGAILITCNGHTVPWDFSLAAVRQWIWRRSDNLVLHYSVRDPKAPLRLPAIRPPL